MAGEFEAVAIGDGGDLHPLGDAAGAAVVGLHDVRAAPRDQVGEGIFGVEVLARGDAHVQRLRQLGVAFHILRRQRLLVPEAAHLLVDAPAAQRLVAIEHLVGVHHQAPALAHDIERQCECAARHRPWESRPTLIFTA